MGPGLKRLRLGILLGLSMQGMTLDLYWLCCITSKLDS